MRARAGRPWKRVYDVQQPGVQPERNLRGLFTADEQGWFWFRSIVPRYYPIPDDGPVGELLAATGIWTPMRCSGSRRASSGGFRSDRAAEVGLRNPFRTVQFDVALLREDQAPPSAQPGQVQPTVVRGVPGETTS